MMKWNKLQEVGEYIKNTTEHAVSERVFDLIDAKMKDAWFRLCRVDDWSTTHPIQANLFFRVRKFDEYRECFEDDLLIFCTEQLKDCDIYITYVASNLKKDIKKGRK